MKKLQYNEIEQIYGYIIHDSKPDPRSHSSLEGIEDALTEAFKMFNKTGATWVPAGGIEPTVRFGAATRNHSDIDIELEEAQIPLFRKGMEAQGYKLCEKIISIKIPNYKERIIAYRNLTRQTDLLKKQIRLINTDLNNENLHYLLKVIDVKVCRFTNEGTVINNKGNLITITDQYLSNQTDFHGEKIQLRNLAFYNKIKSAEHKKNKPGKATDKYDRILLEAKRKNYT